MTEIDVLKDIAKRLNKFGIEYMISGSVAMNFYTTPRMTRDIDIVILMEENDIDKIYSEFKNDYYIDKDMLTEAIKTQSMFNIIHLQEVVKIDFIIRKNTPYRLLEFSNKKKIRFEDADINIVSIEDLIVSKLIWAKDSLSDIQLKDIKNLSKCKLDEIYLEEWCNTMDVLNLYEKVKNEN